MRISYWSSDVCSSDLNLSIGCRCRGFAITQHLAVNLAGRGLRQLAHERDVTREFMLAQALAREVLELVDIRIVRGARGNDESLRDLAANRIGNTDHGGLLHVRMLEQSRLDLDRAHRPAGGDRKSTRLNSRH